MTLSARNTIQLSGSICAMLFCVLCAWTFFFASSHGVTVRALHLGVDQYWWLVYGNGADEAPGWVLPVIFCTSLFSASAAFILWRSFRKTVSSEMFFFTIFIISVSFDAVRSAQLLIRYWGASPYFGVLVSRISYLGRLFGVLCLFSSSLYAMNVQYQKLGTILGLTFFLSLSLAATMPFDSTVLLRNLLYKVSFEKGLVIVSGGLSVFTLLNFFRAGVLRGMREYYAVLVAVILVLVGRELLFFLGSLGSSVIGGVCLTAGTAIFGKKLHSMYLWA